MPIIIALLRGINIGGHKRVKMADLRALCQTIGLRDARTVLQSGNIVFHSGDSHLPGHQQRLEAAIHAQFGFEAQVILRDASAFQQAIDRHPFSAPQLSEPGKCAIVFLSASPDAAALDSLRQNNSGPEIIQAARDTLYIHYSQGMARSKLSNQRIERALKLSASARNWNTCQRISKLIAQLQAQGSRST